MQIIIRLLAFITSLTFSGASYCTVCYVVDKRVYNPKDIPFPSNTALPDGTTCATLGIMALYVTDNSQDCREKFELIGFSKCGCSEPPAETMPSLDKSCSLCTDGSSPVYENAAYDTYQNTCKQVNAYVKRFYKGSDQCQSFQRNAVTFCGCPPIRELTMGPSRKPSMTPTNRPTTRSHRLPTMSPTKKSASYPTVYPILNTLPSSRKPSFKPTNRPTSRPHGLPTLSPTKKSNTNPTGNPILNTLPSSRKPSMKPTNGPTSRPYRLPTLLPTKKSTTTPTASPFKKASPTPTMKSAASPSARPFQTSPTSQVRNPSTIPTATIPDPSPVSTFQRSMAPTNIPSDVFGLVSNCDAIASGKKPTIPPSTTVQKFEFFAEMYIEIGYSFDEVSKNVQNYLSETISSSVYGCSPMGRLRKLWSNAVIYVDFISFSLVSSVDACTSRVAISSNETCYTSKGGANVYSFHASTRTLIFSDIQTNVFSLLEKSASDGNFNVTGLKSIVVFKTMPQASHDDTGNVASIDSYPKYTSHQTLSIPIVIAVCVACAICAILATVLLMRRKRQVLIDGETFPDERLRSDDSVTFQSPWGRGRVIVWDALDDASEISTSSVHLHMTSHGVEVSHSDRVKTEQSSGEDLVGIATYRPCQLVRSASQMTSDTVSL